MSTINKPLPHRPFSLAGNLEKAPRRQHQPQMTSVSHPRPRPYVQGSGKFTVPPVPKRTHLVTRSPSPPYYHAAASDALPSSRPKPSHSFSESQLRSHPNSSLSDLVPAHLRQTRSASFWRRHWFVILISILAVLGISVAVVVVLRAPHSAGVYTPASLVSTVSEAPVGTASQGSATSSIASTSASATKSVTGGPPPSAAPTNPP